MQLVDLLARRGLDGVTGTDCGRRRRFGENAAGEIEERSLHVAKLATKASPVRDDLVALSRGEDEPEPSNCTAIEVDEHASCQWRHDRSPGTRVTETNFRSPCSS